MAQLETNMWNVDVSPTTTMIYCNTVRHARYSEAGIAFSAAEVPGGWAKRKDHTHLAWGASTASHLQILKDNRNLRGSSIWEHPKIRVAGCVYVHICI